LRQETESLEKPGKVRRREREGDMECLEALFNDGDLLLAGPSGIMIGLLSGRQQQLHRIQFTSVRDFS
jgi:uncharacterized protein YciI